MKMFEIATRMKYRFTYKGQLSVEDLWDLSLEALDTIFKNLNKEIKASAEESLLNTKTKATEEIENKIEIIKYIVVAKQTEAKARLDAKAKREKLAKLYELKERAENKTLENMSVAEIENMIKQEEAGA